MRKHIINILMAIAAIAVLAACGKTDATKDYGFAKIYIPQATVTGLDNTYPIPNGPFGQSSAYTCFYKDGVLNINLGVVRSGYLNEQKGFTVDLKACQSETDRKLGEYAAKKIAAQAMPAGIASVPAKIEVAPGTNNGTCYVGIDLKTLAKDKASLVENESYKLLVLGLEIANPTEYVLAEKNTSVVIVLDLNDPAWDKVEETRPESEVRVLFPAID